MVLNTATIKQDIIIGVLVRVIDKELPVETSISMKELFLQYLIHFSNEGVAYSHGNGTSYQPFKSDENFPRSQWFNQKKNEKMLSELQKRMTKLLNKGQKNIVVVKDLVMEKYAVKNQTSGIPAIILRTISRKGGKKKRKRKRSKAEIESSKRVKKKKKEKKLQKRRKTIAKNIRKLSGFEIDDDAFCQFKKKISLKLNSASERDETTAKKIITEFVLKQTSRIITKLKLKNFE